MIVTVTIDCVGDGGPPFSLKTVLNRVDQNQQAVEDGCLTVKLIAETKYLSKYNYM